MTRPAVKVGHKARRGRKRNPVPHGPHRKALSYSRAGRRLKARMAELFAPRIEDFDLDRPRLGISEREVQNQLRPRSGLLTMASADSAPPIDSAREVVAYGRLTGR